MCLAIPMRITAIDGQMATIELDGLTQRASLLLVPEALVGDFVLCTPAAPSPCSPKRTRKRRSTCSARSAPSRQTLERPGAESELTRRTDRQAAARVPRLAAALAEAAGAAASPSWKSAARTPWPSPATGCASFCREGIRLVSGPGCPVCVTAMPRHRHASSPWHVCPRSRCAPSATWCACRPRARTLAARARRRGRRARRLLGRSTPSTSPSPSPTARSSSPASASRPPRPRSPPPSSPRASGASPTSAC